MLPMLVLLACCCCSSSASGAGAYFLGYVPGNDKYYIRIFQLEKMFKIIEDIKTEMVYEGTAPTQYTGKISGTDLCDELIKFKENLDEKRDDEIEKMSDADFKKLVKNYMKDNEIKGYTYEQAMDIIDFMYASCDTGDKRVFKQTADFKTKLTELFKDTPVDYANFGPSTENEAARKIFCDDVTVDGVVTSKGFTSLRKEIADITAVEFVNKMWDGDTGTLVPSGYSLTELTGSVDYCAKDFTPVEPTPVACANLPKDDCDLTTNTCTWTPADGDTLGVCGNTVVPAPVVDTSSTAAAAAAAEDACTDNLTEDLCVAPCAWEAATGCATP
jgi:hypothetical protein